MKLSFSGWYLLDFVLMVLDEYLLLQYVNSINCMVMLIQLVGGSNWYGRPLTHRMFGLNLALQWHLWNVHVQGSSHVGTVILVGLLLKVLAFMKM